MAISDKDLEFIEQVADYYKALQETAAMEQAEKEKDKKSRKSGYQRKTDRNGEVTETAQHFKLWSSKLELRCFASMNTAKNNSGGFEKCKS